MLRHFQCGLKLDHRIGVIAKELLYGFIVELCLDVEINLIKLQLILISFAPTDNPLHQNLWLKCPVEWIYVDVMTLLFLKASLLVNQRIWAIEAAEEIV